MICNILDFFDFGRYRGDYNKDKTDIYFVYDHLYCYSLGFVLFLFESEQKLETIGWFK